MSFKNAGKSGPRRQTQIHSSRSTRRGASTKHWVDFRWFRKAKHFNKAKFFADGSAFLRNNKQGHFVRVIQEIGRISCAEKFRRLSSSIKGPLESKEVSGSKVRPLAMLASSLDFSPAMFSL